MKKLFKKKVIFLAALSLVLGNASFAANESSTVESFSDKSSINDSDATTFSLNSLRSINETTDAAIAGNVNAQLALGIAYSQMEDRSVVLDYNQAAYWLKMAAKQKQPIAIYRLGFLYENGLGMEKDENAAARLYRAAADMGLGDAKCALANCYFNSIGVAQNYRQAMVWYTEAAKQGNKLAQYQLGVLYMTGNNALPADQVTAYILLSLAKASGESYSIDASNRLYFLSGHMRMAKIAEAERKSANLNAALTDALTDQIGFIDTTASLP